MLVSRVSERSTTGKSRQLDSFMIDPTDKVAFQHAATAEVLENLPRILTVKIA